MSRPPAPDPRHVLHPTRDLIRDWRPGDGRRLAEMYRDTGPAFPGGGGWQPTAGWWERWVHQGDQLVAYVTEDRDRIVALCNLMAKPGQKEWCYVPALACRPAFHGKKHGKSVLLSVVEYACRAGFGKVDLNTWAGNMKAVPLYKKSGFMWQPETTVFMENYVPSARRHPLGADFFRRHDWYTTMQRRLDLTEDRVTRGKVRVYEYLWRAEDGDFLRMVFDRQSYRLIEVETPALSASCHLADENLVADMPHRVEWRVESKRPEPVPVFLAARGEPGVVISHRESRRLKGAARFRGSVTIDPDIAEKTKDPKAALLTTEVLVGDTAVELTNGIVDRQAVDVVLRPPRGVIRAGQEQEIRLTVRSHLDRRATARLELRAVHNVHLVDRSARVEVGPRGSTEVPVRLLAPAPGGAAFEVQASVRAGSRALRTKAHPITALACERDGAGGAVGRDTCILCGGSLVVWISRENGDLDVHHRFRGAWAQRLHLNRPQLGPPFSWLDLFQERSEAWTDTTPGRASVCLRSRSQMHPGLVLDRRISLGQAPLVEVADVVANGGHRAVDLERRQFYWLGGRRALPSRFTAPLVDGLRADGSTQGGRGLDGLNLPETGDQWREGWQAREGEDGVVSGIIWERAETVEAGSLQQKAGRVAAGGTLSLPPLHLIVADGSAHTVRGWWRLLHGPAFGDDDALPDPSRAPVELGLAPEPLVVSGSRAAARIRLTSAGRYALDGAITVRGDGRVRPGAGRVPVSSLTIDRPVDRPVTVHRTRRRGGGPAAIDLCFETSEAVYRARARALLTQAGAPPVRISQQDGAWLLDNGILAAQVAPAFMGAMTSLRYRGVEYLNSSYPEGGQRGWRNPWHGGIHLQYNPVWSRLHRERFRARRVERRGRQGLVWRGVRCTCRITQESARHHTVYIEYLLARGADVLAVVAGRRDTLGEWSDANLIALAWTCLADAPGTASFRTGDDRIVAQAAPHRHGEFVWPWGGLVGRGGRALFIGSGDRDTCTGGWAEGPEGCVLFAAACRPVPAGGSVEGVIFVAPAASLEEARAKEGWSAFADLP